MNTDKSKQAVILSAARTPIGKLQGSLSSVSARDLGAAAIRAAIHRAGLNNLAEIDEVIICLLYTSPSPRDPE